MKSKIAIIVVVLILAIGGWAFMSRKDDSAAEIEYRYAAVEKGEIVRSISATGQVVATTTVDVKSKAGGRIVKLAVDEGTIVKKGDLIATIDPSDTQATYEQANADLTTANARASQAQQNYELQIAQSKTDVDDARAALAGAKVRLQRAKIENVRQPALSKSSVDSAQATYDAALAALNKTQKVTIPQMRRESTSNLSQAKAQRTTAAAELTRQKGLLAKGYVAESAVERAQAAAEAANTAYDIAQQRSSTINDEVGATLRADQTSVDRAKAAVEQAKANMSETDVSQTQVAEADRAVRTAEINVQKAIDARKNIAIRMNDTLAAKASTVRNRVSLDNAKVQLDSTTVVAPRDGVVTLKYLEEGTIIPPGTSTFAQGTSLVQISDVTQLYVECAVDEADVANVKKGQAVRISADAFRGQKLDGIVTRVNPAAKTDQNVTAVKVRVKVLPGGHVNLVPGMNATCEFITMRKSNVLTVPSQALKEDGTVRVKSKDPKKPEIRKVEVGEEGNDGVEVKSGLKEGEEVVTAEIDMVMLRDTQKRMQEAEQGGGLAGGGPIGGKKSPQKQPAKGGGAPRAGGAGGGARGK